MRKIISFLVIGILVLGGLGAIAKDNKTTNLTTISVAFSKPLIQNENEFVSININEGNSFIMKQGKPMLPCFVETFNFAFGTKIKSVTVTPYNIQTMTISKDIKPTPQRAIIGQEVKTHVQTIDYGTDVYPISWFEYDIGCGRHNGELSIIVDLQINPIRYHPVEKTIEWANNANVVIEYEIPKDQTSYLEDYQLVVIGPAEYSDELASLITHKNDMGVTSKFVSLTEIYGGTYFPATGRDNQEKIKYFIKNALDNWATANVLLVGGVSNLPVRNTHIWIQEEYDEYGHVEEFASDLYYADIYDSSSAFCSWDSNGNNVFGEYNWYGKYDDVDLNPDVFLGRLACISGAQVTACVNKIITYEDVPGYQQDWFVDLVVVGGDSFPDDDDINEGEYINKKIKDLMTGFIPNDVNVTNGKLTSAFPPYGIANIQNAIDLGCGFVDFSGHGNTNIWATHPHNQHGIWVPTPLGHIMSSHIQELTNGDKLPIVVVEACSTAKFASDTDCFNWAFMYNSNGGAIGSFGASALGWGYIGTGVSQGGIGKMGLDTFRAYKSDKSKTLGEMWANALDRFTGAGMDEFDYKCTEEWEPFGDPSLKIAEESQPPAKPSKPYGAISGEIGTQYTYTSSTTDPNGDKISYMFDWGDGTTSSWIGPLNSGATASANKTWNKQGTYSIKVVAKDIHGVLSLWSDPLSVTMPRTRSIPNSVRGTFNAEIGLTGSAEPKVFLNGQYRVRLRYTIFGGIATYENQEQRFRGIFFKNYFVIKAPIEERTMIIFGRVAFDENHETFTGNWRTRSNILNGWINGVLN